MKIPVIDVIGGTTLNLTWINSGSTPSVLRLSILDKAEALVSSVTPVDSGNGHYFAPLYVPSSDAWYVARAIAVLNTNTYVSRALIRTHKLEVS